MILFNQNEKDKAFHVYLSPRQAFWLGLFIAQTINTILIWVTHGH